MFNICKCNLFHFLYANVVSLLLAEMTTISVHRTAALTTAVNNYTITESDQSTKTSDTFVFITYKAAVPGRLLAPLLKKPKQKTQQRGN